MRHESKVVHEFTGEQGRPQIVIEMENGKPTSLKLLTGRSGSADISVAELTELAQIAKAASELLNPPKPAPIPGQIG